MIDALSTRCTKQIVAPGAIERHAMYIEGPSMFRILDQNPCASIGGISMSYIDQLSIPKIQSD
jgi:hypothetical protein